MAVGDLFEGQILGAQATVYLLDEFKKLPRRVERPQTFMEIGGYAHSENICSNFLAFFFDPEGSHGLRSLFLDALLDSVNREKDFGENVSVDREVVTEAGNRTDILIRSDSYAVVIENKILAAADNPFHDYAAYLDRLKDETGAAYENKIKILLTLYPSGAGAEWGFVNLVHADFAGAVRSALGRYISEVEPRYLMLMLDFLNTLEKLREGTRMNQEYIKLLGEREGEVEQFLRGVQEVRGELKDKVRQLGTHVDVEWRPFDWPPTSLKHALQHRIYTDEKSFVGIQAVISPGGWEIQIFSLGSQAPKRPELETLLNELGIPFEEGWPLLYPTRFSYDKDPGVVAEHVQYIVRELSRSVAGNTL